MEGELIPAGELIPGLPEDMAIECLIRVPKIHAYKLGMVSKPWKSAAANSGFAHWRLSRSNGGVMGERRGKFLVVLQAEDDDVLDDDDIKKKIKMKEEEEKEVEEKAGEYSRRRCRLLLHDMETELKWSYVSLAGDFPGARLPKCSGISMVGENLVVMGDLTAREPREEWPSRTSVWVYNLKKEEWRVGAPMPGPRRIFFAHASDGVSTVFVAGGWIPATDETLRSAMAYDVERDEWSGLPPMIWPRSTCYGTFFDDKFYVVTFRCCCEALDLATFSWSTGAVVSDHENRHETYESIEEGFDWPMLNHVSSACHLLLLTRPITPGVWSSNNCDWDLDDEDEDGERHPHGTRAKPTHQSHIQLRTYQDLEHSFRTDLQPFGWFIIHGEEKTRQATWLPTKYSAPVRGICFTEFLIQKLCNHFTIHN